MPVGVIDSSFYLSSWVWWSYHLRLFCAWTGVAELSRHIPSENPHHVLKQQRAASSFSCWGLFFMAWVIGYILLALILSCIISCTFFFKEQHYLKLLSLEYQLPEYFQLIWTGNVLFWKCSQLLLLFSDGEVLACDPIAACRDTCTDGHWVNVLLQVYYSFTWYLAYI